MAVNNVFAPFQWFPDANGKPLENGFIYIGQPGFEARSSPKASFFDVAQTIPTGTASGAAVRTRGGISINTSNAPAMIYVDGDYSISVCDRNGVLLYSALNSTLALNVGGAVGPVLAADGSLGAAGIGFAAESNTGLSRNGAASMQIAAGGVLVSTHTSTGTIFAQPVSGAGFVSGVTAIAQPLDPDLTALAGVATAGLLARTGAGTAAARTITSTGGTVTITNPDGVAGNINLETAGTVWTDVETIATTSGTTVETATFAAGSNDYRFIIRGVSHDNAATRALTVAFFGSTSGVYTSAFAFTDALALTNFEYGEYILRAPGKTDNVRTFQGTSFRTSTASASDNGVEITAGRFGAVFNYATAQTVTKLRFGWSAAANFDAGSIIVQRRG